MLERHPILQRSVMQDFLQFADVNCQPSGRSQGSSGPTAYFLPKFDTVQTPKVGSRNYEERAKRSVVGEFNRAQEDLGRGTCSNGSSHNWLKQHRSKVGICPHQADYCDTCATNKEAIRAKQTTLNRMRQGSATDWNTETLGWWNKSSATVPWMSLHWGSTTQVLW